MLSLLTVIVFLLSSTRSSKFSVEKLLLTLESRVGRLDPVLYSVLSTNIRSVTPLILDKYSKLAKENPLKIEFYAKAASSELKNSISPSRNCQQLQKRQFYKCPVGAAMITLLSVSSVIISGLAFFIFLNYFREISHQQYCLTHDCTVDPNDLHEIKA